MHIKTKDVCCISLTHTLKLLYKITILLILSVCRAIHTKSPNDTPIGLRQRICCLEMDTVNDDHCSFDLRMFLNAHKTLSTYEPFVIIDWLNVFVL